MERPQERFARQLYDEMARQVVPAKRDVHLSIEGAGINWRVSVALFDRSSTVHCFALRDEAPEFLTIFRSSSQETAIYYLRFRERDRSALISFYGKNESPDVDLQFLADVLKRWLCDEAKPSEMRKDFPSLAIGKIADYYEAGKPIEGEFIDSWDHIERFYDQARFPPKPKVLELIKYLREKGYDRTLRAGQSMFTFILSRSRRHGLRPDQARISFEFQSENEMQVSLKIGDTQKTFATAIAPSDLLTTSLDQLVESPIE